MKAWRNPNVVSFAQAVRGFVAGKDTPRDFLERCIAGVGKSEAGVKAFVTLDLEAARKAADASGKRYKAGRPLSMVDGCPVGIKDIMATSDLPTQMGSPVFKGWNSGQDCAAVYALRRGGAVIFGKTVTTEFAVGYSGPTTNPFDATRTPGGSSSGTAAGVGAGMIPVGLGTQTQGSTLRPASYCGAVGFKPTLGALNMAGVHPLSATNDHLGVIGATLEDVWRVASQISLGVGSPGYGFLDGAGATLPAAVRPRKLIRLHTRGWNETDAATRAAFEDALQSLVAAGVEVLGQSDDPRIAAFETAMERDIDSALDIVAYEMQWPFQDYVARHGDAIGERIRGLMARANRITPADYVAMLEKRRAIRAQCMELARVIGADAYVTLAASGPAPKGLAHSGSRSFIVPGSWLGFPAFALPLMQVDGLPLGLQLLGLDRQDGALCGYAHWVMREFLGD
ncbi:MAG: amidase [Burkholderiales bacterium]|nr:amidase [Burkholderiales bacterium]